MCSSQLASVMLCTIQDLESSRWNWYKENCELLEKQIKKGDAHVDTIEWASELWSSLKPWRMFIAQCGQLWPRWIKVWFKIRQLPVFVRIYTIRNSSCDQGRSFFRDFGNCSRLYPWLLSSQLTEIACMDKICAILCLLWKTPVFYRRATKREHAHTVESLHRHLRCIGFKICTCAKNILTYNLFTSITCWSSLALAIALLFCLLWFAYYAEQWRGLNKLRNCPTGP